MGVLAIADQANTPLFVVLARTADQRRGELKAQNLANTAWAFAIVDKEVCLAAVTQNGNALEYSAVHEGRQKVCLAAITFNLEAATYAVNLRSAGTLDRYFPECEAESMKADKYIKRPALQL